MVVLKKLLLLGLLMMPSAAHAGLLDLDPVWDYMKTHSKEMIGGAGVSLDAKFNATAIFPIYVLHNGEKDPSKKVRYLLVGPGFVQSEGGAKRLTVAAGFNLVAASHKIWRLAWPEKYLDITPVPAFWFGPYVEAPNSTEIREWKGTERIGMNLVWRLFK